MIMTRILFMQRRILWRIVLLAVTGALMACGGGEYSDVIAVSNQFADASEEYINAMGRANNTSSAAAATNRFAAKVEKIAPRMRKIVDKYPELKDCNNVPDELKKVRERSDNLGGEMAGVMMKAGLTYRDNPEVIKAQQRLQKSMRLMMNKL